MAFNKKQIRGLQKISFIHQDTFGILFICMDTQWTDTIEHIMVSESLAAKSKDF